MTFALPIGENTAHPVRILPLGTCYGRTSGGGILQNDGLSGAGRREYRSGYYPAEGGLDGAAGCPHCPPRRGRLFNSRRSN